ncbi:hypothetical protein HaLaN_15427, partial [Haematococcus lacustris]
MPSDWATIPSKLIIASTSTYRGKLQHPLLVRTKVQSPQLDPVCRTASSIVATLLCAPTLNQVPCGQASSAGAAQLPGSHFSSIPSQGLVSSQDQ